MNTGDHHKLLLNLLSSSSTTTCSKNECNTIKELNDSIDLYIECQGNSKEVNIVRYLHGLGIQTKTDPQDKEEQYWIKKRNESKLKMEEMFGASQNLITLNSSAKKLIKQSSTMNEISLFTKLEHFF